MSAMRAITFSAERVTNNFRSQKEVDQLKSELDAFLGQVNNPLDELNARELAEIALCYLEVGDQANLKSCKTYADKAIEKYKANSSAGQDPETLARACYALGTKLREDNQPAEAVAKFTEALSVAKTDWLTANIYRNFGLTQLREEAYDKAALEFGQAIAVTEASANKELEGSLPALYNYKALALTRHAIKTKQDPSAGLALFKATTDLYLKLFSKKSATKEDQNCSNDYQSHIFHHGLVLAELGELNKSQEYLKQADDLLAQALEGRIQNKAKSSRLADVRVWQFRVSASLGHYEAARKHYATALKEYQDSGFKPDSSQIIDLQKRFASLPPMVTPAGSGQSVFSSTFSVAPISASLKEAQREPLKEQQGPR